MPLNHVLVDPCPLFMLLRPPEVVACCWCPVAQVRQRSFPSSEQKVTSTCSTKIANSARSHRQIFLQQQRSRWLLQQLLGGYQRVLKHAYRSFLVFRRNRKHVFVHCSCSHPWGQIWQSVLADNAEMLEYMLPFGCNLRVAFTTFGRPAHAARRLTSQCKTVSIA
jgi:hypothetical protein